MLCKRSSCDLTLRRADWRRFWPLLFLYTAVWMAVMPLAIWNRRWSVANAETLQEAIRRVENTIYDGVVAAVVIAAIFAVLLAMTLYGYLMSGRSVGLMHALPVNRTKQFFNHFLVGVELFTAVHIVTFLVSVLVQSGYGFVAWPGMLTWLAVAELSSLFFFALATLCAMVTGWVIAIPVIYAGVNAMFIAFYALLQSMFDLFYWGYSNYDYPVLISWLTPFARLINIASDTYHYDGEKEFVYYYLSSAGWTTLLVYTVVAVGFVALGWLFYKNRRSESAGDAIVFDWLRPIVLYVMAVVGGMGFGFLLYYLLLDRSELLLGLLLCQIVAGIVVYFAVQMLLNKSFKVFNRRSWLGAVLLAVLLIAIGAVVKFDLFGYEKFVPDTEKVEQVEFSGSMIQEYIVSEDPLYIEKITDIHRAVVAQGEDVWEENPAPYVAGVSGEYSHFSFQYTLTNGQRVRRNYNLTVERGSALHETMNELINTEGVYADGFFAGYDKERADEISGGYYHNWKEEKYTDSVTIDAETGAVIAAGVADTPIPVRETKLTEVQAKALFRAVGQHIERKNMEFIDALDYFNGYMSKQCCINLEFYGVRRVVDKNPTSGPVYDEYVWTYHALPADCTEVLDLLIEFGFAEDYSDFLYNEE